MKALGVTVLRFKRPDAERWRVPFNLRLGKIELPLGLILITGMLFLLAGVNLLTKEAATIGGVSFTVVFFVVFSVSEWYHKRGRTKDQGQESDRFRLECRHTLSPANLGVRPGNILVAVHETDQLAHLNKVLADNDPAVADVVALSVNDDCSIQQLSDDQAAEKIIDEWETRVFSAAVAVAEKAGKPIVLMALPSDDRYDTILQAAESLQSSCIILAASTQDSIEEQSRDVQEAWQHVAMVDGDITVQIMSADDAKSTSIALLKSTRRDD